MKKFLLVLVGLIVFAVIVSNISNSEPSSVVAENNVAQTQEPEKIKEVKDGSKIITDSVEITINSVELTYDVLPDNRSGFYTHYEAEKGKVYIAIDADVYNKAKQNLSCDNIGKAVADYNDGYTYNGFIVVDDPNLGFTYSNITSISPLETQGIKWLINCPQEVEETENPLFIKFTIDGEKFIYNIR